MILISIKRLNIKLSMVQDMQLLMKLRSKKELHKTSVLAMNLALIKS